MIFKHLITTDCPRSCSYCLTRNVPVVDGSVPLHEIRAKYWELFDKGYREVMLTGGEPTCHPLYSVIVKLAWSVFSRVHLTTQNEAVIAGRGGWSDRLLASMVFSIHDRAALRRLSKITNLWPFPVYASVMADFYCEELAELVRLLGFAGITVNENARGTEVFDESRLPASSETFSVRLNRRGHCLDDMLMLLPDLTTIKSFRSYL